jgi:hypothetical protein
LTGSVCDFNSCCTYRHVPPEHSSVLLVATEYICVFLFSCSSGHLIGRRLALCSARVVFRNRITF